MKKYKIKSVGYVYAVSYMGMTKIGWSSNPKKRIGVVAKQAGFGNGYKYFISDLCANPFSFERKIHKTLDSFRVGGEVFSISLSDAEREIKAIVAKATDGDVIQFKANQDEIKNSILSTVDSFSRPENDEFISQFDVIKNNAIAVADAADCEEARQAISKVGNGDIFGIVSALCIAQSSLIKELGEALSHYQP